MSFYKFAVLAAVVLPVSFFVNQSWEVYGSEVQVYQAQPGGQSSDSGNNSNAETQNPFLATSERQGKALFSEEANFMFKEGAALVKRNLDPNLLKKAVLVFYGDWCPHCDSFMKAFAANIDHMKDAGIKVIFVGVPSIAVLKNWRDPTPEEFEATEQKVTVHGIKLEQDKVFVTMIGERALLSTSGVSGLPVFVALKDGKEQCRYIGEKAAEKLNLSDPTVLKNFLGIWGIAPDTDKSASAEKKPSSSSVLKSDKPDLIDAKGLRGVNLGEAKEFTEKLNKKGMQDYVSCPVSYPDLALLQKKLKEPSA